jgi:hypothetical protein
MYTVCLLACIRTFGVNFNNLFIHSSWELYVGDFHFILYMLCLAICYASGAIAL